jgi:hypothetical protein
MGDTERVPARGDAARSDRRRQPTPEERDERVSLAPLDPEEALRKLLRAERHDDDRNEEPKRGR